jgi:hypothetical protein
MTIIQISLNIGDSIGLLSLSSKRFLNALGLTVFAVWPTGLIIV